MIAARGTYRGGGTCKRVSAPPGFEPGSSAWEADILPLGQRCIKSEVIFVYIQVPSFVVNMYFAVNMYIFWLRTTICSPRFGHLQA